MSKKIYFLYNSSLLSLLISIFAFKIQWLEMRINIGYFIPILLFIFTFCFYIFSKNRDIVSSLDIKITAINCILSFSIALIFLKKSILVVPASIIREALGLTNISFLTINIYILLFFIAGFFIILYKW